MDPDRQVKTCGARRHSRGTREPTAQFELPTFPACLFSIRLEHGNKPMPCVCPPVRVSDHTNWAAPKAQCDNLHFISHRLLRCADLLEGPTQDPGLQDPQNRGLQSAIHYVDLQLRAGALQEGHDYSMRHPAC